MVDTGNTETRTRGKRGFNAAAVVSHGKTLIYVLFMVRRSLSRFLAREQNPGAERLPDKKSFKSCRNNDCLSMAFVPDKFRREVDSFYGLSSIIS